MSALLCFVCLIGGGGLAPIPADTSDWHHQQFVRVHIPWHIHQTSGINYECTDCTMSRNRPNMFVVVMYSLK